MVLTVSSSASLSVQSVGRQPGRVGIGAFFVCPPFDSAKFGGFVNVRKALGSFRMALGIARTTAFPSF
jgi:hypothetical protein